MATYDKYWDSVSVERTLLSDSFTDGKNERKTEGIKQMNLNGHKAAISIELLAEMAQISEEEVRQILEK